MLPGGVLISCVLIACIGPNFDSVHFYDDNGQMKKKVDYGRVPQEVMVTGWNQEYRRDGSEYDTGIPEFLDFSDVDLADEAKKDMDRWERTISIESFRTTVHHARNLEIRGQFQDAIAAFRNVSHASRIRSFARERQELLNLGAEKQGYNEYLRQRYLIEFGSELVKANATKAIALLKTDPVFKPYVAYTLACAAKYDSRNSESDGYLEVAKKYPASLPAESAMIMAARAQVERSNDEISDKGAEAIFSKLLTKYPNSRFRSNIEGWRGANEMHQKHVTEAITHYVRQSHSSIPHESWKGHQALAEIAQSDGRLADAAIHWLYQRSLGDDLHFKYDSARQLRFAFNGFSAKDARLVQLKVRSNEKLLSSYLDFRLEDTSLSPQDEQNLLAYISTALARLPHVNRNIYARLAQIHYNSGRYNRALTLARKARSAPGELGNRARYIEAASLARMGNRRAAIKSYEALYRSNPPKHLRQGTAEALALLDEEAGNYIRAFELYTDIGYDSDAAFIADSVMSPAQLARVVRSYKRGDERNALNYTLAMRYFRKGQYEQARQVLIHMPVDLRKRKGLNFTEFKHYLSVIYFEKAPAKEIDPLDDVVYLQHLRGQAEGAKTQSTRAKAIYAMAQYSHSRRNLMFYSAGLWHGTRADMFGLYWNTQINKGRSNAFALQGALEHECDAQTMKLCEELVRRCPHSRLVPKALYTAGVSAESLGRFNSWWERHRMPMVRKAIGFMTKLVRKYPHNELAKPAKKYADEFVSELKPDFRGSD